MRLASWRGRELLPASRPPRGTGGISTQHTWQSESRDQEARVLQLLVVHRALDVPQEWRTVGSPNASSRHLQNRLTCPLCSSMALSAWYCIVKCSPELELRVHVSLFPKGPCTLSGHPGSFHLFIHCAWHLEGIGESLLN